MVKIVIKTNKEFYQRGLREQCEDITCAYCGEFITSKQYDQYKTCKKNCFNNKQDEILICCERSCADLGIGQNYCLDSCKNKLF